MDTRSAAEVEADIADIKAYMPETYKAIQAWAGEIGKLAYAMVRAGLRGEPNRFWAMERGRVMGTPFNLVEITADVALAMVRWGSAYACIFGTPTEGGQHGAD